MCDGRRNNKTSALQCTKVTTRSFVRSRVYRLRRPLPSPEKTSTVYFSRPPCDIKYKYIYTLYTSTKVFRPGFRGFNRIFRVFRPQIITIYTCIVIIYFVELNSSRIYVKRWKQLYTIAYSSSLRMYDS